MRTTRTTLENEEMEVRNFNSKVANGKIREVIIVIRGKG